MFDNYLTRWHLMPMASRLLPTAASLLPARHAGVPAMLKIAVEAEKKWGSALMIWWDGNGATRVLAHEGDALLLERALGKSSLVEMARCGRDDEASRIICAVAAQLHARKDRPSPPALLPLSRWFEELDPADVGMAAF